MHHLLIGVNVTMQGYGLLLKPDESESAGAGVGAEDGSGRRGPLTVLYAIDWSTVTPEVFQRLLLLDDTSA